VDGFSDFFVSIGRRSGIGEPFVLSTNGNLHEAVPFEDRE
jgi:hypothetical protein